MKIKCVHTSSTLARTDMSMLVYTCGRGIRRGATVKYGSRTLHKCIVKLLLFPLSLHKSQRITIVKSSNSPVTLAFITLTVHSTLNLS